MVLPSCNQVKRGKGTGFQRSLLLMPAPACDRSKAVTTCDRLRSYDASNTVSFLQEKFYKTTSLKFGEKLRTN